MNSFLFDLVIDSPELLSNVTEMVRSRPSLSEILDVEKCTQFVQDCRDGRIRGDSLGEDAQVLGALSTMCYAFECFDRPTTGARAPAPLQVSVAEG